MPKAIRITLVKSLIAAVPKNVKTAHALGLRKIGQSTVNHPTPAVLGMVHQVKHLLKVEEVEVDSIPRKRRNPKAAQEAKAAAKPAKAAPAKAKEPVAAEPAAEAEAPKKAAAKPAAAKPAAKKPATTKKKSE